MRVLTFARLPAEMQACGSMPFISANIHSAMTSAQAFHLPDPGGRVPSAPSRLHSPIVIIPFPRRSMQHRSVS